MRVPSDKTILTPYEAYELAQYNRRRTLRNVLWSSSALVLLVAGATIAGLMATSSGPPAVPGHGEYAYMYSTPTGTPVGYDPCTPIQVEVQLGDATQEGYKLIEDALDTVSRGSGLTFEVLGETKRQPQGKELYTKSSNKSRPSLIAWTDHDSQGLLEEEQAGYGGSVTTTLPNGQTYLTTGEVLLDSRTLSSLERMPGGREVLLGLVVHEVGHLVGLDHVDDPEELMYPKVRYRASDLRSGDLTGLQELGNLPCRRGQQ